MITRAAATGCTSSTALGDSTSSHTCDGFGDPATLAYTLDTSDVFSESYTRDRGARLTERAESIDGQTHTYGYEYDTAWHLVTVTRAAPSGPRMATT